MGAMIHSLVIFRQRTVQLCHGLNLELDLDLFTINKATYTGTLVTCWWAGSVKHPKIYFWPKILSL